MNEKIDQVINLLEQANRFVAKNVIFEEFEVVLERLKVLDIDGDSKFKREGQNRKEDPVGAFQEITSPQMLDFLAKVDREIGLATLVGLDQQALKNAVRNYFESKAEVSVTSAVVLSERFKGWLAENISSGFQSPVRVIFETDETIVAGCVISGAGVHRDYSYRKNVLPLMGKYLSQSKVKVQNG